MALLRSLFSKKAAAQWSARMGWRYVTYIEGSSTLSFQIEPMGKGADVVYLPDEIAWKLQSPKWALARSAEIISRLKSVTWNRQLTWNVSPHAAFLATDEPVKGSIESTPGGKYLEDLRMFHPGGTFTQEQTHQVWHEALKKFAAAATGRVTIFAREVNPDSTFALVELPALKINPNVTLDFK